MTTQQIQIEAKKLATSTNEQKQNFMTELAKTDNLGLLSKEVQEKINGGTGIHIIWGIFLQEN